MRIRIHDLLIFAAGVGVGSIVTWMLMKDHYQKIEIDYEDIHPSSEEPEPDPDDYVTVGSLGDKTEELNRIKAELEKRYFSDRPERIRYDRTSDEGSEDLVVDEERLTVNHDDPSTDIYVITPEQYSRERFSFDKNTLYFWEPDRLLTDEEGDILDVPPTIGMDAIDRFGEYEPDEVYVRNELMEMDFEVIMKHKSYYDFPEFAEEE